MTKTENHQTDTNALEQCGTGKAGRQTTDGNYINYAINTRPTTSG